MSDPRRPGEAVIDLPRSAAELRPTIDPHRVSIGPLVPPPHRSRLRLVLPIRSSFGVIFFGMITFAGGLFLANLPWSSSRQSTTGGVAREKEMLYARPLADGSRSIAAVTAPSLDRAVPKAAIKGMRQEWPSRHVGDTSGGVVADEDAHEARILNVLQDGPERSEPNLYAMVRAAQLSGQLSGAGDQPVESDFAALEMAMVPEPPVALVVVIGLSLLIVAEHAKLLRNSVRAKAFRSWTPARR